MKVITVNEYVKLLKRKGKDIHDIVKFLSFVKNSTNISIFGDANKEELNEIFKHITESTITKQ